VPKGCGAGGESFAFSVLCLESAYTRVRGYFVRLQFRGMRPEAEGDGPLGRLNTPTLASPGWGTGHVGHAPIRRVRYQLHVICAATRRAYDRDKQEIDDAG
jgi:hypothetical protein